MAANVIPSTGLLTIDTKAIADNWKRLNDRVQLVDSKVICSAVVKANAYGLGVIPVSEALVNAGCTHFFVSTLNEAIELRECLGFSPTIFVLGGVFHGVGQEWEYYRLVPVIFDVDNLALWLGSRELPYALKVDTGMHRLGISASDFQHLIDTSFFHGKRLPQLLMSHLACADDSESSLNIQQHARFSQLIASFSICQNTAQASLANSSGIFLGKNFHFDLVRPGVALYGVNPTPYQANPMMPVVKLQLPVMQIKHVPVGGSIGYSATFVAKRETRVAIIFGGYADGLMRSLSNVGAAYIADHLVPIIGRVSMDSLAVDITDLSSHLFDKLTHIDVINEKLDIDALAKTAGTSGYEILTSLGVRYQRRYV